MMSLKRETYKINISLTHSFPMHLFSTPENIGKWIEKGDRDQGIEKGWIGNEWVNMNQCAFIIP